MKYVVQVGQDFECYAVEDNSSSPFTITLNQTLSNSFPEAPSRTKEATEKSKVKSVVALAVFSLVVSTAFLATVHGVVAGDYSQLRALVSSGQELVNLAIKFSK